jgi:hypothetical protein
MIAITSIAPKHINNDIQLKAIQSWVDLGMVVYSMNSKAEVEILSNIYPMVNFIVTDKTMELIYQKPYVSLTAIFDWCKTQSDNYICLINSDIELKTDKETIKRIENKMNGSILLCNRVNYDNDYSGFQYKAGIDVFFIHKNYLQIYPPSMYALGQCHFDYWIPYRAVNNGIDVCFIEQNIAFHKNHNAQYNHDSWMQTGRYFMWENNLYQFHATQGIGQMSTFVFNYIYNATKRIKI